MSEKTKNGLICFSSLVLGWLMTMNTAAALEPAENFIEKTLTVSANQEQLWSALTVEEELGAWWNEGVRLEPKVGGEFYEPWGEDQLATGVVIAVQPMRSIEFTWQERPWQPSEKTVCAFFIEEVDGTTQLRVKHSGWEAFEDPERRKQLIEGFGRGWDFLLPKLKSYLEENTRP